MSQSNRGISTTATVIVVVAVIVVAGIGTFAYVASRAMPYIFSSNQNTQNTATQGGASSSSQCTPSSNVIQGNSISETISVCKNTNFTIQCNSCTLTFNVDSGVTITLTVQGDSNQVTVNGGSTELTGQGNYNTFYFRNTQDLGNTLQGTGNSVQT